MSRVVRFLSWWRAGLAAVFSRPEPTAFASLEGGLLRLSRGDGQELCRLLPGRHVDRDQLGEVERIAIRVPDHRVIRRTVEVPSAARDLEQVARFALPQWSPYRADDTLFAIARTNHVASRPGFLMAQVGLCSIEDIAPVRDALLAAGAVDADSCPRLVEAGDGLDGVLPVSRTSRVSPGRLPVVVNVLNAAALVTVLVLPFAWLNLASDELTRQLEVLRPAVAAVQQDRDRERRAVEALEHIDRATTQPIALPVLFESLARELPDHTHLESLELGGGTLVVRGVGASAANLPAVLDGIHPQAESRLTAPLVRVDAARGRDRFEITVDVAMPRGMQ